MVAFFPLFSYFASSHLIISNPGDEISSPDDTHHRHFSMNYNRRNILEHHN